MIRRPLRRNSQLLYLDHSAEIRCLQTNLRAKILISESQPIGCCLFESDRGATSKDGHSEAPLSVLQMQCSLVFSLLSVVRTYLLSSIRQIKPVLISRM